MNIGDSFIPFNVFLKRHKIVLPYLQYIVETLSSQNESHDTSA